MKGYAEIASPLTQLQGKTVFQWDPEKQAAFEQLKTSLVNAPVLVFPDFAQPFILSTDACLKGISAILSQRHGEDERVVSYGSRGLRDTERKYSVGELEALAVVWGVKHYNPYLYGRKLSPITGH